MIRAMIPEMLFDYFAVRLNGPNAADARSESAKRRERHVKMKSNCEFVL